MMSMALTVSTVSHGVVAQIAIFTLGPSYSYFFTLQQSYQYQCSLADVLKEHDAVVAERDAAVAEKEANLHFAAEAVQDAEAYWNQTAVKVRMRETEKVAYPY